MNKKSTTETKNISFKINITIKDYIINYLDESTKTRRTTKKLGE